MPETNICQSCGMPMDDDTDFGTAEDGSPSYDYCAHCYKEGKFIIQTDSVEEFAEKMIEAMAAQPDAPNLGKEAAIVMLNGLERWK